MNTIRMTMTLLGCLGALSLAHTRFAQAQQNQPPAAATPAARPTSQAVARPIPPTAQPVTFLTDGVLETQRLPELVEVRGEVFEDANGDGKRSADEPALAGVSIAAQMMDDKDGQTRIAAVAVTDKQGRFALQASRHALLTVMEPEGWRAVGPVTQFAATTIIFALRPERITVERVLTISPDLKVNVDVPPARIDLTAQLTYAALALGGLGILAAGIVAAAIHAHTCSRYKTILATAAARAARTSIGDSTWQAIIEQIVVDAANRAIRVERFLGMSPAWIRFSDRAGQRVTLGTSRAALRAAGSPGGRRINPLGNPFAVAQLHGVWRYFASQSNTVRVLPIDCVWWLTVEPVENQSTALTQVPRQTRLGMAWDHLRGHGRTRMRVLVHREVPTP